MSCCPICGKYKPKKQEVLDHLTEVHSDTFPQGYTPAMYFYSLNHNGSITGKCRICNKPTEWVEKSGLPRQLCGSPKCKELASQKADANMMKARGVVHMLNDSEHQKKMLAARKISGVYHWSDGKHSFTYTGTYEQHGIEFVDKVLELDPERIQMPGPALPYVYEGVEKFWITDIFLEDYNLIVEIKDGGTNKNMHPGFAYNRAIEAAKDEMMKNQSQYNYIKLTDKNMLPLVDMIEKIRVEQLGGVDENGKLLGDAKKLIVINENALVVPKTKPLYILLYGVKGLEFNYTGAAISFDLDLSQIFAKYNDTIIRTSKHDQMFLNMSATVLKYVGADLDIGNILSFLDSENNISVSDTNIIPDSFHFVRELLHEGGSNSFNDAIVTPDTFFGSESFSWLKFIPSFAEYEYFIEQDEFLSESVELELSESGVLTEGVSELVEMLKRKSIVDIGAGIVKGIKGKFNNVEVNNGIIEIRGIKFTRLMANLKELYDEKGLYKMFEPMYKLYDQIMFERKKIKGAQRTIDHITAHEFFALELFKMFQELNERYKYTPYASVASQIFDKTWLSRESKLDKIDINLAPLNGFRLELNDYQVEFIREYPNLKVRSGLRGYILSFDQGLGKTLTAIALAECLGKDKIYIVCPNSLKENWAYEIKKYFKKYEDDESLWQDEVFIVDNPKYKFDKHTKFIICNQESIPKMYPYIDKDNNMVIIDESHNFRNLGKRSNDLIELTTKLECQDILFMSGTPIKSAPSEIVPAMRCIDPLFTEDVAKIYTKCFSVDGTLTSNIVTSRFSRIMFRRTKEQVLTLPEKFVIPMKLKIPNGEKYEINNVRELIVSRFKEIYNERLKENKSLGNEYANIIRTYSSAPKNVTEEYIDYIIKVTNTDKEVYLHELTEIEYNEFVKRYIVDNVKDPAILTRLAELKTEYLNMKQSSMGRAIGEILPKYRAQLFIDLYDSNRDEFIKMITVNNKKTVIFSSMLSVVNHIHEDLNRNGVGTVKVIGGMKDRMEEIIKFKEDDSIDVLIATSQTLSTGITLTEADQMFFFGTPWRSADFDQASDRIHRIGQTNHVHIWTVLLDTDRRMNISTRMQAILDWSSEMFGAMVGEIGADDIGEEALNECVEYVFEDISSPLLENVTVYDKILLEASIKDEIQLTTQERAEIKKRFGEQQCSFHRNGKGYYAKTHRCRTPYYATINEIPLARVEFVSSTS
jgi:SNF2 family DNA or RNA helicase